MSDTDESIGEVPGPWSLRGVCRKPPYKTDDFFLEGRFGKGSKKYEKARDRAFAACRQCPVKKPCLAYALLNDIRIGIWGETTASDRKKILYPGDRA